MDAEREKARWRRRRIIYNNDGDEALEARSGVEHEHDVAEGLMVRRTGDTVRDFLDARSTTLIGSQVDSNWFSSTMAGLTFSHHTRLGGFYGREIPLELVEEYGRDTLRIQVDFSREHGMEAAWGLRMNDAHDAFPPGSRRWTHYGLAPFKREHPECMLGREGDYEKHQGNMTRQLWTRLDFAVPAVRGHIYDLIAEVAHNYDVDLIGMEFFKYWPFFRESMDGEPVTPEHVEMMTGLLRRLRRMADDVAGQRGRPLLLAAHTPFGLDECQRIGVDLETWLAEGLIDQFSPGGTTESVFRDSYTDLIGLGHQHGIPVYPCLPWAFWVRWAFLGLSDGKYRDSGEWFETLYGGQPERAGKPSYIPALNGWEGTLPAWRGAAMSMFNAGADGLYVFNGAFCDPSWLHEIGEVATMAGKDRLYGIDKFEGPDGLSAVTEVELPASVGFQVGEDVGSAGARRLDFSLHLWDWVPGDDLSVRLNGASVGGLEPAYPDRNPEEGQWLQGRLDAGQVKRGPNQLEVVVGKRGESASSPLILDAAQLRVRCEPE